MTIKLQSIHYYPVKGLAGAALPTATLTTSGLAFDRRFGIAFADSSPLFAGETAWQPWNYFVSLKKQPAAALITASAVAEGDSARLTLQHKNGACVNGNPADAGERQQLQEFLSDALQLLDVRLIDSHRQPLWDQNAMPMSLVNIGTVAALADAGGQPLQTARFRANLLFDGAAAWSEEKWHGKLSIGAVQLAIAGGIPRCPATTVNPDNALRDCNVPQLLIRQHQHNELGIFATVKTGGEITVGMEINVEPPA